MAQAHVAEISCTGYSVIDMYNTASAVAPIVERGGADKDPGGRRGFGGTTMDPEWNDNQPIYRQIRDRVVAMILDGFLGDGDALPSVRTVASESRVNPLTVLKAYQQLVDEGLVEKRRGLGMFVLADAQRVLLKGEREKFLAEQWPAIQAVIRRLGFTPQELLAAGTDGEG